MSEIQRWEPTLTTIDTEHGSREVVAMEPSSLSGRYVTYADLLRAVTLAKIEVLESLLSEEMVPVRHSNGYAVRAVPQVSFLNKIAALRKDLGDE